jgi:hypothetical protein
MATSIGSSAAPGRPLKNATADSSSGTIRAKERCMTRDLRMKERERFAPGDAASSHSRIKRTADERIKESKNAVIWTRLSCQTFRGVVIGEIPASTTTIRGLWVIPKPPIVASRTAPGKDYPLLGHFFSPPRSVDRWL